MKKALDYCDLVVEEALVNGCLHGMLEEYHISWRIFLSQIFPW